MRRALRQWSLDGKTWKLGATVITEKTLADDYTGIHNTAVEQTPFARLIAESGTLSAAPR